MRPEEPIWLLVGGASIVAERVSRALRETASRYVTDLLDRVAASRPVCRVVDIQLARTLESLVDEAMPIVLDRLGQRREQVRLIMREHGEDLTGELIAGIRERAATADGLAERTAQRLVGRAGRR